MNEFTTCMQLMHAVTFRLEYMQEFGVPKHRLVHLRITIFVVGCVKFATEATNQHLERNVRKNNAFYQ